MSKGFLSRMRLDANVYRRDVSNFADDDQLLNTGISYPVAFDMRSSTAQKASLN